MKAALVRSPPSLGGLKTGLPFSWVRSSHNNPPSPLTSALVSWLSLLLKFPPASENVLPGDHGALISPPPNRCTPSTSPCTPNPTHPTTGGGDTRAGRGSGVTLRLIREKRQRMKGEGGLVKIKWGWVKGWISGRVG